MQVPIEHLGDVILEDFKTFKKNVPTYIYEYLKSREFDIRREFKIGYEESGLGIISGELKNSYITTFDKVKNGASVTITNTMDYASYMELGTKPHMIYPKNSKYLHFFIGGIEVFTKKVSHPGTRPYEFMDKGADLTIKMLENGIGDYLRNAFIKQK